MLWDRLADLVKAIGKSRLVLDLSCRKRGADYFVVTDRWQKFTDLTLSAATLQKLGQAARNFSCTPSMSKDSVLASIRSW